MITVNLNAEAHMEHPLRVLRAYPNVHPTLPDILAARVTSKADAPFLIHEGQILSWSDFESHTIRLARAFLARGITTGQRIAIAANNHPAHLIALFAAARIGAILVPVNPAFSVEELSYIFTHSEISGLITTCDDEVRMTDAISDIAPSPWRLLIDAGLEHPDSFEAAIDASPVEFSPHVADPEAICVMIYTSGTTGRPKGVMHSQRNFIMAGEFNIARLHLQRDDRILVVLPFFHVNALFYSVAGALSAGASLVTVPRFSASRFWQVAADTGATVVNIIESIGAILEVRDRNEFRADHRIRVAYGVRSRFEDTFRNEFGIKQLVSGFGMTEVPCVTCTFLDRPNKSGSMGVVVDHPDPLIDGARCMVVDEEGKPVQAGEVGELLIRSSILMKGYFRDPVATAATMRDEWLATGDLVRQDEEGIYFFVSRQKDIIRRRGENIAGAELDAVISEHPDVHEVAAIAVPSEWGEDEILAAIVPMAGASLVAEDIAEWCRQRLAPMKVPRFVAFLDSLPHTASHKIAKAELRADPSVRQRAIDLEAAARLNPSR